MENIQQMELRPGQRLKFYYQNREFEAVIINPHAFGKNQPSVGLNFRMIERCSGITHNTLWSWSKSTRQLDEEFSSEADILSPLKLPNTEINYSVHHLSYDEEDKTMPGDRYKVIEVSEFIDLCFEAITYKKLADKTRENIKHFLKWFAVEGFYAQVYTIVKGVYTRADSEKLQQWLISRFSTKPLRIPYARFVAENHQSPAFWTNYTYLKLFGKIASEMRKEWEVIDGNPEIARNHIPESVGLEAVGFVERMVVDLYVGDFNQAHDMAIDIAQNKFELPPVLLTEQEIEDKLYSHKTQKLKPDSIKEIRDLYANTTQPITEIARNFKVFPNAIKHHCKDLDRPE